ncbi:MAG: MliC family protein [Rhizobiaceae bacterium]|nr:MliC family protein [Rhizobiaceae bacterium]
MKLRSVITALVALGALPQFAAAAGGGNIRLQTDGTYEHKTVTYDCASAGRIKVTYVNADPNFLAIVPVKGQKQDLIFASVISGSGARYAAGKFIWWNKGKNSDLYDSTLGDNAPPVMSCTQAD